MTVEKPQAVPIAGQAFEDFLNQKFSDPSFKLGFERKLARVKSIADVLRAIEKIREQEGIPKAEVARRMDRKPEAVSRLLRGQGGNPTLDTLVDLADAIGVEFDIRIKRQPQKTKPDYSPLKVLSTL